MNQTIEELVHDLAKEGIVPPDVANVTDSVNTNNKELEIINSIEKSNNQEFSDEQKKILLHHGSMIILACAGSGKTTVSINLIAKRILNGEIKDTNKLIYTTYSKAGQLEMKDRLKKLFGALGIKAQVEVRTLHSFFLQILRTFGVQSDIISEADRLRIIKKAAQNAELRLQGDDLQTLNNLLSYQVNNLMSDQKAMDSSANTLDSMTIEQYTAIRQEYAVEKSKANKIDFDDMMTYLYIWAVRWGKSKNPVEYNTYKQVIAYCKALYDYFIVDEAQDTSLLQHSIIKALVTEEGSNKLDKELIYIGDDDQVIYSWRGSDPSIILTVGTEFNIPTYVLSTNYRCKSTIVNYATVGVKCNSSRFDKEMHAFNKGGDVKVYPLSKNKGDLCNMSIAAMNHIKYWISQGHKLDSIAVLSRNNFHLAILNNMLMRSGIYCNITDEMKLTKSSMYQDLKDCIELTGVTSANGECYNSRITGRMLWKLCSFMGVSVANSLAGIQDSAGLSFKDLMGYLTVTFIDKDCSFNKKLVGIGTSEFKKMQVIMNRFAKETKECIKLIYNTLCSESVDDRVYGLILIYKNSSSFMYKASDKRRAIAGLIIYFRQLMMKDGIDNMLKFLKMSEQLEAGKMEIPGEKITLTTIHSAKGREWRDVIMFGCDNVAEPAMDYIRQLYDEDMSINDLYNYIDEERRIFYVGNTRAKENLFIITYDEPSVFLVENLGESKTDASGNNNTVINIARGVDSIKNYLTAFNKEVQSTSGKYFYDPLKYAVNEDDF